MFDTFSDGHDELYHHAKFGEIEQRAPAVGAKIWCLHVFFVFCFGFVTLRSRRAVRSRGILLTRRVRTHGNLAVSPHTRHVFGLMVGLLMVPRSSSIHPSSYFYHETVHPENFHLVTFSKLFVDNSI